MKKIVLILIGNIFYLFCCSQVTIKFYPNSLNVDKGIFGQSTSVSELFIPSFTQSEVKSLASKNPEKIADQKLPIFLYLFLNRR